jgi:hypothetical protein
VDLPEDGSNPTFDGRDGKVDGTDDNTVVIVNPRDSGPPASQQLQHNDWVEDNIVLLGKQINFNGDDIAKRFIAMDNRLLSIKAAYLQHSDALNSKIDSLLQKMDAGWTENTVLREAYHASREQTAVLRAAVDALTKRIDENITIPAPPSPDLTASSTTMEEMTMQLSVVQHDIQDILEDIRNPPGERKRRTSTQDTKPTMPMDRRLATYKQRDTSLEPSLMHSQHATSAAQDALDALMCKYPPCPLTITSTEATTDPLPDSPAVQDTTLPDAPTTAPVENERWRTVEGKAAQKKRRNEKADNNRAATTANNTLRMKTGGKGKNTH